VVVAEELVAGDVGEEDIGPTVVVEVADGDSHAVAFALDASLFGDVGEGAVAVVVEEAVPIAGRFLLQGRDCGTVDEVNVQPAVVIVVDQADAGDHGFGLVLVGCGGAVGGEA